MKTFFLLPVILLIIMVNYSYSQVDTRKNNEQIPSKENPVVIQKAKKHVYVELSKEIDENGQQKVVAKEVKTIEIPESFPKYIDTGNPKEDEARYYEAKQKWIKEHPQEYEKIKHLNL